MAFLNTLRKRLGGLLLVVFGVSLITFSISHLIPGDPARLKQVDVPRFIAHGHEINLMALHQPVVIAHLRLREFVACAIIPKNDAEPLGGIRLQNLSAHACS